MVDKEVIESLCISIRGSLKELSDAQDIDWNKFVKDNRSRRFVERLLQIAIEAMIDIGHHIISDEGFREPQSYRDVFKVLTENGILSEDDLPKYEKIASFRNILVHHYEKIDDSIVYGIFKNNLKDLEEYVAYILSWLEKRVTR
ncbi:MAG: hypothetical protein B6I32_05275 [Desulfobacterium sp. 4572_20]|nr:MAG: hypothetical protein B6I32_05275 [Desulfobacterium sp. 4572_20]